ncbi:hypothetical protein JNM87_01265 [Candidatus Saccharibacteria bacterium]|nr:hypothetical protein [Candidatus Saccharibacteria bacterium]
MAGRCEAPQDENRRRARSEKVPYDFKLQMHFTICADVAELVDALL